MSDKLELKLTPGWRRDEVEVIDTVTGAPIPFEWTDSDTIAVDKEMIFAGIRLVPKPPRSQP